MWSKFFKMARWKRVLAYVAVALIVLLIVVRIALSSILIMTVEKAGTMVLGAPVKMEGISLALIRGFVEVRGFSIGAPEGFNCEQSITVNKLRLDLDPLTLLSPKIVIEEFTLNGVRVYIEQRLTTNNLFKLKSNAEEFTKNLSGQKEESEATAQEAPPEEAKPVYLQIDKLSLTDIGISVGTGVEGTGPSTAAIPMLPIVLENLGQDDRGITPLEVLNKLLDKLATGSVQALSGALTNLGGAATDGAQAIGGAATDGAQAIGGAAADGAQAIGGAVSSLKNLFGTSSKDTTTEQNPKNKK